MLIHVSLDLGRARGTSHARPRHTLGRGGGGQREAVFIGKPLARVGVARDPGVFLAPGLCVRLR